MIAAAKILDGLAGGFARGHNEAVAPRERRGRFQEKAQGKRHQPRVERPEPDDVRTLVSRGVECRPGNPYLAAGQFGGILRESGEFTLLCGATPDERGKGRFYDFLIRSEDLKDGDVHAVLTALVTPAGRYFKLQTLEEVRTAPRQVVPGLFAELFGTRETQVLTGPPVLAIDSAPKALERFETFTGFTAPAGDFKTALYRAMSPEIFQAVWPFVSRDLRSLLEFDYTLGESASQALSHEANRAGWEIVVTDGKVTAVKVDPEATRDVNYPTCEGRVTLAEVTNSALSRPGKNGKWQNKKHKAGRRD